MKRIHLFSSLVLMLLLSTCKKEIELDLNETEGVYVLNAILSSDSTVKVEVAKSVGITQSSSIYPPIQNASISLKDQNGQNFSFTHIGNGVYQSSNPIQTNQIYDIRVSSPSIEKDLSAQVTSPIHVDIQNIDTFKTVIQYGAFYSDSVRMINLEIIDPEITQDYYSAEMTMSYYSKYIDEDGKLDSIYETKNMPLTTFYNTIEDFFELLNVAYFSDLNNSSNTLKLSLGISETYFYDESSAANIKNAVIKVVIYHLSKELYLYAQSIDNQSDAEFDPFAVPVIVYENIENGVGIFGARTATVHSFVWP